MAEETNAPRTRMRLLAFSILTTLLFFGGLELVCRGLFPDRCGSAQRLARYLKAAGGGRAQGPNGANPGAVQASLNRSIPMPYDPYLIWHLVPSFQGFNLGVEVSHNSRGLRSPEVPLEKPANTVRILLLGDSTTYGHGVETDRMLRSRLEQRLQAATPGRVVQVINGGVPGYSSLQSLNLFRRVTLDYHPDIVVVISLWSDCIFDRFEDREVIYGGGWRGRLHRFGQWVDEELAPSSALYCVLKERVFHVKPRTCPGRPPLCAPEPGKDAEGPDGDRSAADQGVNRVRQPGASTPASAKVRVALEDYRDNLKEIAGLARAHDAGVVFAIPANRRDVGEADASQPTPAQYRPYREAMRQVAAQLGAPLVDFPAAFTASRARGVQPLFMDLVHPTAEGNEVMAEALGRALLEDPGLHKRLDPQSGGTP